LLGVPAKYHHHKNSTQDELWKLFVEGERRDFLMMASSQGKGEIVSNSGIVSGHAYSLLSAHEFWHDGNKIQLVKLRNPWGHKEWSGAWSDND